MTLPKWVCSTSKGESPIWLLDVTATQKTADPFARSQFRFTLFRPWFTTPSQQSLFLDLRTSERPQAGYPEASGDRKARLEIRKPLDLQLTPIHLSSTASRSLSCQSLDFCGCGDLTSSCETNCDFRTLQLFHVHEDWERRTSCTHIQCMSNEWNETKGGQSHSGHHHPECWLKIWSGPDTGGSRFIRICLNLNWPSSEVTTSQSLLCCSARLYN